METDHPICENGFKDVKLVLIFSADQRTKGRQGSPY